MNVPHLPVLTAVVMIRSMDTAASVLLAILGHIVRQVRSVPTVVNDTTYPYENYYCVTGLTKCKIPYLWLPTQKQHKLLCRNVCYFIAEVSS